MTADRTPEPCTTWSRRKRHYSTNLEPAEYGAGRTGRTLCREEGSDQDRVDYWERTYPTKKSTVIDDLPVCGRCRHPNLPHHLRSNHR